jgi:hypothetical protein
MYNIFSYQIETVMNIWHCLIQNTIFSYINEQYFFLSNEERLCTGLGTYEMFLDSGILCSI